MNVEWTIRCSTSPAVLRSCGRCGTTQSFFSTGKFRLNANGSRLDAWLIYRCAACGKTWNRTIFERRPVSDLSRQDLHALQSNDSGYADRIALASSNCSSGRLQPQSDFTLTARCVPVSGELDCPALLVIRNPDLGRIQLDTVLVRGLRRSRKEVLRLVETGILHVRAASPKVLRRPTPTVVTVECHAAAGDEVMQLLQRLPE